MLEKQMEDRSRFSKEYSIHPRKGPKDQAAAQSLNLVRIPISSNFVTKNRAQDSSKSSCPSLLTLQESLLMAARAESWEPSAATTADFSTPLV